LLDELELLDLTFEGCFVCQVVHFVIKVREKFLEVGTEVLELLQVSLHLHLLRLEPPPLFCFYRFVVCFELFPSLVDTLDDLVEDGVNFIGNRLLVDVKSLLLVFVLIYLLVEFVFEGLNLILDSVSLV